jgi:hypothetical protein
MKLSCQVEMCLRIPGRNENHTRIRLLPAPRSGSNLAETVPVMMPVSLALESDRASVGLWAAGFRRTG